MSFEAFELGSKSYLRSAQNHNLKPSSAAIQIVSNHNLKPSSVLQIVSFEAELGSNELKAEAELGDSNCEL